MSAYRIHEKQNNKSEMIKDYEQFGIIATKRKDCVAAGRWFIKAILLMPENDDSYLLGSLFKRSNLNFKSAERKDKRKLSKDWKEANLDKEIPLEKLDEVFSYVRGMIDQNPLHDPRSTTHAADNPAAPAHLNISDSSKQNPFHNSQSKN
uniref:Uncharacterized protein n=1 Tax=uncultured Thiotrichaceae bacterium TaxID=298394 RepID=A0A6S6T1W0_9GAMM|nr:MAG: Unknown protein [uncultured Thiotrichaceae bacterium]